ncbi:hypothetical protein ACOY5N_20085 [Enterobacter kobei]|uniref:hypothetical protein n=1 Tax=Enterobacter cloacae complex TaxID=354276 RepID=UPI000FC9BA42|nr:hypothetical protein [Enterobacter kobei]ELK6134949.1 hypothetical protein [Enterobacter kobei]MBG0590474.1 hypothetical protein [Enterobacter kobei]MCK7294046.1 hypothetical protein [Enterobacter kobei]MDA4734632.1 hypothetical protein [Enterobacter kobei]MDA4824404.1 hypothetical protein [Enterobacter kobei]
MKVLEYSVLVIFDKNADNTEPTDTLKEYLLARGYKIVSSFHDKPDAYAYLGMETQVMAKSETDIDGANLLKKRLLRLFRKVTISHGEFPHVFMMISLSNATTVHVGRRKSGTKCV